MKRSILMLSVAAAVAMPVATNAAIYQFNATLSAANENPPATSNGTGIAMLSYNDFGTPAVADDRYSFTMSVSGLTGNATAFHIHGAATPSENAPVRIPLDGGPPFLVMNSAGSLLVGGNNVTPPDLIPATLASATNAGHPAMTFLSMLTSGLAYANVHTAAFPSGEIRGQLIQVSAVPEPETYALMLAGLGLVGWVASRRRVKP